MPLADYKNTKEYVQCPKGTWAARIYQVIDLGTQKVEWEGATKHCRKVRLTFEVFSKPLFVGDDGIEKPFALGQEFTLSFDERANLRAALEGLKGEPLTDEEMDTMEIWDVLGWTGALTIIHKESKGKTYANINSYAPFMEGVRCPSSVNEPLNFSLVPSMFSAAAFSRAPKWSQDKIITSPEWKYVQDGGLRTLEQQALLAEIGCGQPNPEDIPF